MRSKKIIALVLAASLINTTTNIGVLVKATEKNIYNQKVPQRELVELKDNIINVTGSILNRTDFKVGFDIGKKEFKVYDQTSNMLHEKFGDDKFWSIRIFDSQGNEKKYIELKASDYGNSSKLDSLKGFKYEFGDYIELWHKQPYKQVIAGNILGSLNLNKKKLSKNDIIMYKLTQDGLEIMPHKNNLNNTTIHIKGSWWESYDEFIINFNKAEKNITLSNRGSWYSYKSEQNYCTIQIFRKNLGEIFKVELNGYDTGQSEKLNALHNFKYEYGDVIKIWHKDFKNQIIDGYVLNTLEDYRIYRNNEINTDVLKNLAFEITENGLKEIHNKAPNLEGVVENIELNVGEEVNLQEIEKKIKATDDIEGDITKKIIRETECYVRYEEDRKKFQEGFKINNTYPSIYKIKFIARDLFGKEESKTMTIKVTNKLEKNKINVCGSYNAIKFRIGFDEIFKKFLIEDQVKDGLNDHDSTVDKIYFTIKVLDKENKEKAYVELTGRDFGTSDKLDILKNLNYEYGDILIMKHLEKERFKITGDVIDAKENYGDGVGNYENLDNTVFQITEQGLKAIYNEAPIITGPEEIFFKKLTLEDIDTKNINLYEFLGLVKDRTKLENQNDYMQQDIVSAKDDIEGDISHRIKEIDEDDVDFLKSGIYKVKFQVSDLWGRTTEKVVNINIVDFLELEKNFIRIDGFGDWGKRDKFKIGFNLFNKTFKVYDQNPQEIHSLFKDYFSIKIFDKKGKEKKSLTLNGSDFGSTDKLNELKNFKFQYGDLMKLWHAEPNKLHIKGPVIDATKDYSDESTGVNRNDLILEITKDGLKEVKDLVVIEGIEEKVIRKGEKINLLEGVKAIDKIAGDISNRLITKGNIDVNKVGEYFIEYSILNSLGVENKVSRKITVVEVPKLEKNKIDILGYYNRLFFTIGFDDLDKEFKIYNQDNNQIHIYYQPQSNDYFSIKVLDKNINEKLSVNLIGSDKGTTDKLNKLKNFKFEYGDFIKVYHLEPNSRLRIFGDIIDAKESYADGVQNRENIHNTVFQITKDGLKAIVNEAPIIKGAENIKVRQGENFDLKRNIIVTDDLEGNITDKLLVKGNLDTSKLGDYAITYEVTDSLGRKTIVNRVITVIEVPKLESNIFEFAGEEFTFTGWTKNPIKTDLKFKLGFDDINHKLRIYGHVSAMMHTLSPYTQNKYFEVKLLDKNGVEKVSQEFKGSDTPYSPNKISNLYNIPYEYGDILKIYHAQPEKLRIIGKIIDGKENYADGINNINNVKDIENIGFEITKDGLKYIYNNKPEIKGVRDITIRQGEAFNKLEGITAIDDRDGNITSKINVTGDLDVNNPGEYKVIYTVVDSWGRQSKATSNIKVISKPKLENSFIQVKGLGVSRVGEGKFKIGFDDIKKELKLYERIDFTLHDYFTNKDYFKIKILNKNRKEKLFIDLLGNDKGTSNKLDILNGYKYEYGDRIKFWHAESNRLDINGEVIDSKIDYSKNQWFDTNAVEFEITENGLKAIYNKTPIITGVDNVVVKIGEAFDNLENVIVKDDYDKNLVPVVTGAVDVNKLGNYELTYVVKDSWGAERSAKRIITVRSNTKPTITGANKAITNVGQSFNVMEGISANDVEDNDLTSSIKVKGQVNTNLVGTYTLTYTVVDSDGNKVNATRTIVVKSNDKPIITGTENITIKVGDAFDSLFNVEARDTEDGDLTQSIKIKGNVNTSVKGNYDLIYSVVDDDGNESTVTRRVTVRSNDRPILQGIKNITLKIGDAFDKLVGIRAIDTEDGELTNKIKIEGDVNTSKVGVYNLIYIVTDSDGNKVRKSKVVTVKTNNKPVITGIDNVSIKVGDDFDPLVDVSANDTEDSDITDLIKVDNKVDTSKSGEYEVIYTVTDSDKNITSEKRIVTVRSNNNPIIEGVRRITLKVGDDFNPLEGVTARDIEDGEIKSIKVVGNVDTTIEGINTLIYSVIDNDGNETVVERHITVKSNKKPVLLGMEDLTIKVRDDFDNMADITAYDEEDGEITDRIKVEGNIDSNNIGVYKLTYRVIDDDGNEVSQIRNITVRSNNKPRIEGANGIVIKVGDIFDIKRGITVIDDEDKDITSNLNIIGEVNVNVVGKYELTYSATDSDGNITTVKRAVRVRSNNKPIITGVEDIEIKLGDKFNPLFKVLAKDTEDGDLTHNIKVENTVNTSNVGEYELIYSVKDLDENLITLKRKVKVRTNDKPVINGANRLTIKVGDIFDPLIGITAKDTEDGDLSKIIKVDNKVDTNKVGTYDVIYSIVDKDGNKTVVTRKIKVKSNDKPKFLGVNNITIKLEDSFDPLVGVTAQDTEDGDLTSLINIKKGTVDTSKIGTYDLIYSVVDKDGNETVATRRVIVRSNSKPSILGVDNIIIKKGDSFNSILGVTAADIEDGDLTNLIKVKGDIDNNVPGIYEVIYSVLDNDGNKVTAVRRVTVITNEKPILKGVENATIKVGEAFDIKEGAIATDLEDGDITKDIVIQGNVDINTVGTYDLIYLVRDSDNNETIENRVITVRTNERPVIIGADSIVIKVNDSFDPLKGVTANDAEDTDLTALIKVDGDVDLTTEGNYILTYSVIDTDGNETMVSRNVMVRSNNKPKLTGIGDAVIKIGDDFDKLIGVEATDYEDGEVNHLIKVEGEINTNVIGTYNLSYSVTDNDGNTITANRVVTVRSNDKPIILGADNKIIKVGDIFNEREGITVTDTEDKDLINSIVIKGAVDVTKIGKYVLDYLVEDSDGNKTVKTRVITVRSNDKPIITGANDMTIKVGDAFDFIEGVTVMDTEDGEITDLLEVEGDVDTSKVGIYNLIYSLTDEDGNELKKTRAITVRSNDKPIITGVEQVTIKEGDFFDKLKGVIAKDTEDDDITDKIIIEGEVDTSNAAPYSLFYSVADSDGNKVRVKRRVIVRTNTKPSIDIDDITIKIGEILDYRDGLVAKDVEDGDLTKDVKILGNIDNTKAGIYDLNYSVTDKDGNTTNIIRKVTVRTNDIPIIEGIDNTTIKVGDNFDPILGISVKDTEDGDLIKSLNIKGNVDTTNAGKYDLVYSVIDTDGNLVSKTRTIFVRTNDKPIIKGAINTKIKLGDVFDKLKGISAIDTEEGDLTNLIKISGNLDNTKAGNYELFYSVKDNDGNTTTIKRQIRVRTNEQPILDGVEDITIKIGESFDSKQGVTANDKEDGDLTASIIVKGKVDTTTEGIYNLEYLVKDKDNNETVVTRNITVRSNTKPIIRGVEDITIKLGDVFHRTAGVIAIDKEDGTITNLIKVEGKVNTAVLGEYNVKYSVEDSDGNTTTAQRKITVRSNNKPEILGLNNVILKVGDKFNSLEGIIAKDSEDLDLTNKIVVEGNLDTSVADIYRLNYSVTDSDGNKVTVIRIIEVKTNEKPVLLNVEDAEIKAGETFEPISGEVALDKEDGDISNKIKYTGNLDVNTPGKYELIYSVIDSDGNETVAKRIVNVLSNEKPIISGAEELVIKVGDSFDPMEGVIATDTEDNIITNLVKVKGRVNTSSTGIYNLIYSVIDSDGNETIENREIRVRSNERPVILGAEDMTITQGYTFDKFISIIARDKEDGDLTDLVSITGDVDVNKLGVYNLTYSVTDDDGNITKVNRAITVRSNNKPIILGIKNTTIKLRDNFDNMQGVTAADTEDKDLTSLLIVRGNVDTSVLGTYNLTYIVTDSDNNTTTSTRKITVRSNDKPIIIGATEKVIKLGDKFDKSLGVIAKDTEDGEITNRITIDGDLDVNTIGEYELIYSVIDDDGNKESKTRKITVRSNDKPILTGVDNITIKIGDSFNAKDGVIANDTEDKDLTDSISIKGTVDSNTEGKYKLTYSVIDKDGNKTTVNRSVIVKSNEKPLILGVKNTIIKIGDLFDERIGIVAKDKEDGDLTKKIIIKGNVDVNTLGEYELTYSVMDKDGNTTDVIRKVTVRSNNKPMILGVKNETIKVNKHINLKEGITAIDYEDKELTDAMEIAHSIDNTTPGVYEVMYSVTDSDENTTKAKRLIKVESNDVPLISGVENNTIKAGEDFDPMDGVVVTDTEDGEITNKIVIDGDVDVNAIGEYELIYSVIDDDGNKVEKNRIITVRSNEKPIILNADNKIIKVGEVFDAKEGIVVTDLEDKDLTNNLQINGKVDTNTSGTYILNYYVIDSDGNEVYLDREIIVETNDKPIITGLEDLTIKVGEYFDYFTDIIASDTENGDLSDKVYVKGKVDTDKAGIYTLDYGVVDSDGNETIITRKITVRSNEKPVIIGANHIVLKVGSSFNPKDSVIVKDKEDGDITNNLNISGDIDLNNIGRYILNYSVLDRDNNKTKVKRIIRVRSNDKPIINGVNNETIIVGSQFDALDGIIADDTEDGDLTELIEVEGAVNSNTVGEYELKYSITDEDGNETIESKIVTVRSNEIPVIKGADTTILKVGEDFDEKANVTATDKEDGDITNLINIVGNVDTNKAGNYDLIYSIKDNDGNISKIKRRVKVRSNEKPILKGVEDTTIKVGDDFDPSIYVEAIDYEDGDLSEQIKIEGEVNINSVGKYELNYLVTDDDGNQMKAKRIITVRSNEIPTITGINKSILKVGDIFDSKLGVLANDYEDGNITSLVKVEGEVNTLIADDYKLVYSVTDSDGNTVSIPRIIKIRSNKKPIFKGVEDIVIKAGDSLDLLAGIVAIDEEDGDLSELVEMRGVVDTNTVGEYEITYLVTDNDNNESKVKRKVTVRSNEVPMINGIEDITLKQGDYFNPMLNIEVLDTEDGNLTDKLVIKGEIDINTIGTYKLIYSVIDSDENETIVKRKVKIRSNEKPEITGVDNIVIKIGEEFNPLLGIEAIDSEDGNISDLVTVVGIVDNKIQGNYPLIYSIKDSDGNITTVTRSITVKGNDAPIILGIEDIAINLGENFDIMAGVSAKNAYGDDISENIEVIGALDITKPGLYKLIYLVSDNNKNNIILTRNIIVENPEEPIIIGLEHIIVNKNYEFDSMAGIEISNLKEDQKISSIEVLGTVDTSIEGDYNLIYVITDNKDKKFTIERVITVISEDTLILHGADDITLKVGADFDPKIGVMLNNHKGEDLTEILKITGTVNTNIPGIYTLVYSVLDKEGELRVATRDIKIIDKDTPIIYGINDLILNFGDKFDPLLGISATDIIHNDLNENIKVVGKVDTNSPGTYNLVYSVTNRLGKVTTITRTIEVKNKNGNLIKGVENVILREGDIFDPMAGVKANYKNWEEITKLIKVIGKVNTNKPGKYKLIYSLTDKHGVKAVVGRSILVKDDKESLIQGIDDVEINVGDEFNPMLGVIAKDKNNNDLTKLIKIEGNVDFRNTGKYSLIYSLIDNEGIKTQITRYITVTDNNTPKQIGIEDISISDVSNFNPIEGIIITDSQGKDITDKVEIKGGVDDKNGSYTLQYSVIDEMGNKLEQNRIITVETEGKIEISKGEDKKIPKEKKNILYDENGKAILKQLVPYDEKPKPLNIIGLILMAIGKFIRRKKD